MAHAGSANVTFKLAQREVTDDVLQEVGLVVNRERKGSPTSIAGNSDRKVTEFIRQNTIVSMKIFRDKLMTKLFGRGDQRISWKHLYYTIKGFGILASKTIIWNLFLDAGRKARTEAEDENPSWAKESETFERKDFTAERVNFLFHMTESYKNWKRKPVPRWKTDLLWAMFTGKFLKGNGCNFLSTLLIFIMTILLVTVAVFPMGTGIFDTFLLCKVIMGMYAMGTLWYFCSLLGEYWYPYTYGGLIVNFIFLVSSSTFCVLLFHVITPGYYEDNGCFKCPSCTETADKLCYEFSNIVSVNYEWSEANTCSCALEETLRINEPLIPYGMASEYCGGDNCTCDAILSNSHENWGPEQEYYKCLYFSQTGTPLFFFFGGMIIFFMVINVLASLFCCIYLIMMCIGCGKGAFRFCVCLGINFEKEQHEAQKSMRKREGQLNVELNNRL
jgi:hypothetical protein